MSLRSRLPVLTDFLGPAMQPEEPGSDVLVRLGSSKADLSQGFPAIKDDEITLMFSGGVDSTATAVMLAEKYRKVHLVTYRNGYGHYYHHRTEDRVRELQRRLGEDRFAYTLISVKDHFDKLLVNEVLTDYRRYKSGFIWFMGCKMAMHMRTIVYCLEHGLKQSTDGSNSDTDEMVEQSLLSLSMLTHFYEDHDVHFGTPVYEVRRADSRELIRDLDLKMGVQVMDRHLCIQPTCVAGELYYMPYLFFNKPVKHDDGLVSEFIERKAAIARRIMQRYFADKGVDLDALLASRRV